MEERIQNLFTTGLKLYGFNSEEIIIQKKLNDNWHGDYHYKILAKGKAYSARIISARRYDHSAFVELNDHTLTEQMKVCETLSNKGIPYMRQRKPDNGEYYVGFNFEGEYYRLILFDWIYGLHLTRITPSIAEKIGHFAREFHDAIEQSDFDLPFSNHNDGTTEFLRILLSSIQDVRLSLQEKELLDFYITKVESNIDIIQRVTNSSKNIIIQSDLNPMNILWDESNSIVGVVDFEHFCYSHRIHNYAWLLKWYSRTQGVGSHDADPILAKMIGSAYRFEEVFTKEEIKCLPFILWMTGCFNWNFIAKTKAILLSEKKNDDLLIHLNNYLKRGESLVS